MRIKKTFHTLIICFKIFRARTFGMYCHSGWDGNMEYVQYEYKGETWKIPTGPIERA